MAEGWIKLHRCLLNKAIFDNPNLFKTFTWCLLKATHKPHRQMVGNQKVDLWAGQFITGRDKAGEELRMNASTVWRYLKTLENNETLNIKSNNKFSVITLLNWELYQYDETNSDSNIDNKRTTNEQQMNTNKNGKKGNNEKNIYTPDFEKWYLEWPRADAKRDSFNNFEKIRKSHGLEIIWQSTQNYLNYQKSIPDKDRGPYYSSRNFFGQKAYYEDYIKPKLYAVPTPKNKNQEALDKMM